MLGVASYQESLRALGACAVSDFRLIEQPDRACVHLTLDGVARDLSPATLLATIEASRARRGEASASSQTSDVLRAVGLALDELQALNLQLVLCADALDVAFRTPAGGSHELSYAGEELQALRETATARRQGQQLKRVLILHDPADTAGPLRELLLIEFAVQALPVDYARAVAEAGPLPDAVLASAGIDAAPTLEAIRALKTCARTRRVPIVVVAPPDAALNPADVFEAGADDLLPAPYQPAQLRARMRTWLLRRGAA